MIVAWLIVIAVAVIEVGWLLWDEAVSRRRSRERVLRRLRGLS